MKGMFWNSNGLRDQTKFKFLFDSTKDQAKFKFLFDSTKEQQLDFIAILETKRNNFTTAELAHFCANNFFLGIGHRLGDVLGVFC
jgi:hypothetical protein